MNVAGVRRRIRLNSIVVQHYRHDFKRNWAVDFDGMRSGEVETRQFVWC